MDREHKADIGEVPAANPDGRHCFPHDSSASANPRVGLRRLEWMGPHAFEARYGTQPRLERDFGMWWGPRQNQRAFHRCAIQESPTGPFYTYDLTWDECAVLATDVRGAVIEAVRSRALASDRHLSAEELAGLTADHLPAPTPDGKSTTELAAGIEL
jgi:hypothetical protein